MRSLKGIIIIVLIVAAVGFGIFLASRNKPEPAPIVEPVSGPVEKTIGTSVQGRAIKSYTYGSGTTHLAFVGGIHGGYEWNSVLLAYQMMDHLAANPTLIPANQKVTIIPSANPDGVFKIIGKEGRFALADVPTGDQSVGRFNANGVDLNRNFDCKWQSEATWRGNKVGAGTAAFSEPEARAIRDFMLAEKPKAAIFWHSQANAVYASECTAGVLPETRAIMNAYATAAGYKAIDTFDAYPVTGDVEGWLASINIPAITVELSTHETIEWEKNLAGAKALFSHFALD